jgi:MFS family permease
VSRPLRDDDDQHVGGGGLVAEGAAPAGPAIGPGLGEPEQIAPHGSEAEATTPMAPTRTRAGARYAVLAVSHAFIDVFPILFVVLNLPLKQRLGLDANQVALVYALTPIFSGTLQPVFAYLSDKLNTRVFSPLGLAIGAACIGSIGFAQTFEQLITLQIIGVIATGFYHPVGTALAGQTGSRAFTGGRAFAVGLFIAAGMVGQAASSYLTPRLVDAAGMQALAWYIIPALVFAVVLHQVIRHIPHRGVDRETHAATVPKRENVKRWFVVGSLCVQNCLRFIVNIGMFAMFNVWAGSKIITESHAALPTSQLAAAIENADREAAKLAGTLIAAITVGMGLSVVLSGRLIKHGHERFWLAALSFVGAGVVASLGYVGDMVLPGGGYGTNPGIVEIVPLMLIAALAPIGFFSTFPIAASLGQRLQPAHTSLVMSLLMGVGWASSASAPYLAQLFLGESVKDAFLLPAATINRAFVMFAGLLVLAGLLAAVMPKRIVASVADEH